MSTSLVARIIYRSVYTLLCFILLVLILVTPGDAIRQALPKQAYHIVIISAAYVGTVLVVGFIYAVRLYVNRSILSSIPKSWIPIEKGDVNKEVRKMIASGLSRSAAIAFEARPRDASTIMTPEVDLDPEEKENGHTKPHRKSLHKLRLKKTATMEDELGITLPPHKAVWGEIEHFGWASPNSPDLPNLQYSTVISELPNLIEAKALTLAPPDPESQTDPPLLDREAVALLQRPESMSLRDYLTHLVELGVLNVSHVVSDFVGMYEYARYSTRPISNVRFRELMHAFAEILRGMENLDPAVLNAIDEDDDDALSESDIDDNAPMGTNPGTPLSKRSQRSLKSERSLASESGSSNSGGSQIRRRPALVARNSSQNTWTQYRTAPTTPRSKRTALSRTSSANSFAQTRHPYPASASSSSSTHSGSGGSVIRLSDRTGPGELPYVLRLTDTYDDQPLS